MQRRQAACSDRAGATGQHTVPAPRDAREHFLAQWEGAEAGGGMPVLLRSAASNPAAADRLREAFQAQVTPAVARIGPPETARVRAGLVATQLLGLAMTRYVLALPPVVAMTPELIVRAIGATVQRYVAGADL